MSNSYTEYDCIGFNESLPKGKTSGRLHINSTNLVFHINNERLILPLQGLKVSMGGASNRLVFFEHSHVSGWNFYVSDPRLLQDEYLQHHPASAAVLHQAKRKHVFGWGLIAAAVSLLIALPLLLVLRMDILTGIAAKKIPLTWEQKLGETTLAQYQLGKNVMEQKQTEKLLSPLTNPLVAALEQSPYQYHFHIVNDGSLNAFALPGGEVVIHSALILRAESAEELLGVLAHEITHVEQQHGLRGVMGAAGIYLVASAVFGDVSGILATLGSAAPLLLNQRYSRRFETEADEKGFKLLQKAQINPDGLASFFEKMIAEEKKQLEKIDDEDNREMVKEAMQFLSTHPSSEKRIKTLKKLTAKTDANIRYRSLNEEFSTLQAAVKQFITKTEGEKNEE